MSKYINDLETVEKYLDMLGMTNISDLSEHNYFSLLQIIPNLYIINKIVLKFISLGYIQPFDEALHLDNIDMETRLKNILKRNCIFYLQQLSVYPEELIYNFRGLGKSTMHKLKYICFEHDIHIPTLQPLKTTFKMYKFNTSLYFNFFIHNITSIDDFKYISANKLYSICNKNYILTIKTFKILKANNIILKNWGELYLFEALSFSMAQNIFLEYNICTVSELCKYLEKNSGTLSYITPDILYNLKNQLNIRQQKYKEDNTLA